MSKSIQEMTKIVDDFVASRNWDNSNPNHLITSIFIELGELAEHYQWKSTAPKFDKTQKLEVGYEFVDVIFYLFKLASISGIDIEEYFDSKLEKLKVKFPIGSNPAIQHELYRKTGKNRTYN